MHQGNGAAEEVKKDEIKGGSDLCPNRISRRDSNTDLLEMPGGPGEHDT